ncbi:MAG: type III-B CRISPR module RAMP protein Cmr6 [Acidobacteriota bacterium]
MPPVIPMHMRAFLVPDRHPNPSLFFDRAYEGYSVEWRHAPEGKKTFLETVANLAGGVGREYRELEQRRTKALEILGARSVVVTSSAPLIAGIGRWNPSETGFTLDRNSGAPYFPGSSVKGLLRAAATLVHTAEIGTETDREHWTEERISAVFGSGAMGEATARRGTVSFYDAFPVALATLSLGVMTVHYKTYYRDHQQPPADWDEPIPIHHLRIDAGARFRFWFRGAGDVNLERLLRLALDWLGAGAKKSSGYGWFEDKTSAATSAPAGEETWPDAVLNYKPNTGTLEATAADGRIARATMKVPEAIRNRLKKKKVVAQVRVRHQGENWWEIIAVDYPEV